MRKDLVSVIVPVYNVEKYVEKCIESILCQTYSPIEIIIVDDGATDDSGVICDRMAKCNDTIRVVHKKNEGLGFARNTGLEYAHGKYVVFVDSDDWVLPDFIMNLYTGIIENEVDYCKSGFCRVNGSGEIVSSTSYSYEVYPKDQASRKLFPRMLGSAPDKHDSVEMSACAVMYKAEIINRHEIRFPSEREIISEDIVFNMDYLNVCNGAAVISNKDYMYRINNSSLTHTYRPDRFEAYMHFYEVMRKNLDYYGYDEGAVNRLKRILFVYIRSLIRMEANHLSDSTFARIGNIRHICGEERIKSIIGGYPVYKMQFPQRIFVILLKNRMALSLFWAAKLGVL